VSTTMVPGEPDCCRDVLSPVPDRTPALLLPI
jgi:hypothetical protein